MTRQVVKDEKNEMIGVMLVLTKEEAEIFEDQIEDMLNYENDLMSIEEAKKESGYKNAIDVFSEIEKK